MLTGAPSARIEARRNGEVLSTASVDSGLYILRVRLEDPLDAVERSAGTLWVDDQVEIYVDGAPTGDSVQIAERGYVTTRDLVAELDDDVDDDGIPNNLDNCSRTSNTGQSDSDGNGVGDACEGALNIPLGATPRSPRSPPWTQDSSSPGTRRTRRRASARSTTTTS
jgi:hypothetical protein